jgi:small subunit ribosomal protein S1
MESNDLTLGQDMGEPMSDAEHTPPAAQAAPESSDNGTPQTESAPAEATPLEVAGEESISVAELEHAVEAVEPDVEEAEEAEVEAEPEAAEGEEAPRFRRGELVDGIVIATSPTEVLVDLGEGMTGVIASRELERMDRSALEALKVGSEIMAYVLKARGSDGHPVLSLARAEEEKNWRLAETYFQNKQVYFSKVAGYNKGGLIVRFGKVRGFVPASQISRERQQRAAGDSPEEKWGNMVGEDIAVKVVEIDRARNRLILSERAAAREWREQKKAHLLEGLAVGEVRQGRVISIADFGAFVDLGGADGLVHLTELSWKHITHPREVLEVGQEVEVEVISIDRDRKRIGLSMKRREDDPWQEVVRAYTIGQLVQATVTKLTKFGAFARLVDAPEIEGLIHISELADYRVSHPREVVLVGDVLTLRIVKIDADQRRLGLSLRQVDSAKYMDQDWQFVADEMNGDAPPPEPPPDETESDQSEA